MSVIIFIDLLECELSKKCNNRSATLYFHFFYHDKSGIRNTALAHQCRLDH